MRRGVSLGIDVGLCSWVEAPGWTCVSIYAGGQVGVTWRALVVMPVDQAALVLDVDLKGRFRLSRGAKGRGGTLLERSAVNVAIEMRLWWLDTRAQFVVMYA